MQILYFVLLALDLFLFILCLLIQDKKCVILSMNCKIILCRENGALNLYQNRKKIDYAFLSFGNFLNWYILGKKHVYVVCRFKNQFDMYAYDQLPQDLHEMLSKKVDLSAFQKYM